MNVAIVGSRGFKNYEYLEKSISIYFKSISKVISGGAKGADSLAKRFAQEKNIEYIEYPADWDQHGKAAGFIRNLEIVNNCDVLVAYWDSVSNGTKHSINIARKTDKPVLIFLYTKQQIITFNWDEMLEDVL